jgi:c-di-GMP-binding flagellar brake protein YcgR
MVEMLKTVPRPEKKSSPLVQQLVSSRDEIVEQLKHLRQVRAILHCFIDGGLIPVGAKIEAVLPSADGLVLATLSQIEHQMLSAASTVTAVVSLRGVKTQFVAAVKGGVSTSSGVGVRLSLPTRLLRLQRRAHVRARPPRIRPLECMVRGETNLPSKQRMAVLDIGVGGVALRARADDRHELGERLLNCSFNLGKHGEFTTDLIVRHIGRAEGAGGWRYGCAYAHITARALERVCCYIERIEEQRRTALSTGT